MLWIRFAPLLVAVLVYMDGGSPFATAIVAALAFSYDFKSKKRRHTHQAEGGEHE